MPIHCVVFDIDDTLYLERDYVLSGLAAVGRFVAAEYQVDGFADAAWRAFERGVRGTIFNEVLREFRIPATGTIEKLVAAYRQHLPQISLLPDAAACLAQLQGRVQMSVVTDGPLESQQNKATALRLAQWCAPILFTAALGADRGKPHPQAFEQVERETGCRGGECVYVADNPTKDFQGPQLLSWRMVRVRRPLGLHHDRDTPPGVDAEMPDLTALGNTIEAWADT